MSNIDLTGRLGWARTADGYTFYRQADGSYSDGDLYFASADDLRANADVTAWCAPLFSGQVTR
jgi:hypothetical protein